MVIRCKLSHWEPLCPVILLVEDVPAEVLFYDCVEPFRLSICLGVVSSGHARFDFQLLTEGFPKF